MARESMREMMEGVAVKENTKPRLVANNTVKYIRPDGAEITRLHHTDIIEKYSDGSLVLNSGGWRTVTTKDRLNSVARVWSDRGVWYVGHNSESVPFFDGMRIAPDGSLPPADSSIERDQIALAKQINAFCKKLDKFAQLPEPGAGDCWFCALRDDTGKTMGEHGDDSSHLLEHIKEGYLHGSLILNAIQWAGYPNPGFIWQFENAGRARGEKPDFAKRALRRYLRRKLGLN